jgi:hypothetical protein
VGFAVVCLPVTPLLLLVKTAPVFSLLAEIVIVLLYFTGALLFVLFIVE